MEGGKLNGPTCCWHSHQVAQVASTPGDSGSQFVTVNQEVLHRDGDVGEGATRRARPVLEPFEPCGLEGYGVVIDEIGAMYWSKVWRASSLTAVMIARYADASSLLLIPASSSRAPPLG